MRELYRFFFARGLLCCILVPSLAGCALPRPSFLAPRPPLLSQDERPSEAPYAIGVGDVLMVAPVSGADPIRTRVDLDGKIRLPGQPAIEAAGRTCSDIENNLAENLPSRVVVTAYESQRILVAGLHEEKAPRPEVYCGPETVAQFLKRVGCPDCQTGYRVRIVRPSEEISGEPEIFAEEMDAQGRRRDETRPPLRLQPGDYLYVERNFGRKGPLTLMTDRQFFGSNIGPAKQLRLAQAVGELKLRQ